MAIFTRINGDAFGVVNSDSATHQSSGNGSVISTGIQGGLTAFKIVFSNGDMGAELVTGGAVETALRTISANASILAYQVSTGSQLSVFVERNSWVDDTSLANALKALGNIGATGAANVNTVSSAGGIKLA